MKYSAKLVFSFARLSLKPKNQPNKQYRIIIVLVIMLCTPISASASVSCKGRFVNPISDVCWSCLLPISIGQFKVGGGMSPKKRDTKNPSSPICACSKGGQPVPIPGISLGF